MKVLFTSFMCIVISMQPLFALSPGQKALFQSGINYFDLEESGQCVGIQSIDTPDDLAPFYLEIFERAAVEYEADLNIMITVFWVENGKTFPPSGRSDWAVSGGGAKGPWQFLDRTWGEFGVDANGDGVKDVNNIEDSSYGAANYIGSLGGSPGLTLGDLNDPEFSLPDADVDQLTVARIFKSYNAGPGTWRDTGTSLWTRNESGSPTAWGTTKQTEIDDYISRGTVFYAENGGGGCAAFSGSVIFGNTANILCEAGEDLGEAEGWADGKAYIIRLCNVNGITVNSQISGAVNALIEQARLSGVELGGGGYRSMQGQIDVRRNNCGTSNYDIYEKPSRNCSPQTARPGYSNHQMGFAIDFTHNGSALCFPNSSDWCRGRGNKAFDWLDANATNYGLENLPSEAWHWSVDGS